MSPNRVQQLLAPSIRLYRKQTIGQGAGSAWRTGLSTQRIHRLLHMIGGLFRKDEYIN